jgi:hypothetical protein
MRNGLHWIISFWFGRMLWCCVPEGGGEGVPWWKLAESIERDITSGKGASIAHCHVHNQ